MTIGIIIIIVSIVFGRPSQVWFFFLPSTKIQKNNDEINGEREFYGKSNQMYIIFLVLSYHAITIFL